MSDGPHRSLPMGRCWKRVAQFADNTGFSTSQVSEAIPSALREDWKDDISNDLVRGLRAAFGSDQPGLFQDQVVADIEALAASTPVHGLGRTLVDCALEQAHMGNKGPDALVEAAKDALTDRFARRSRQTEEHYCRESSAPRALDVRGRMEDGLKGTEVGSVARHLLGFDASSSLGPAKRDGLDDGVPL